MSEFLVEHYDPEVDTSHMVCPHCGKKKLHMLRNRDGFSIACFCCFAATNFVESPSHAFVAPILSADEKMEGN